MSKLKQNPERMAWTVLISAFSTFCLLSISVPVSIYWYAVNATTLLPGELTSVRGIVLIGTSDAEPSTSVTDGTSIPFDENMAAVTDETSQAIVTFADDSSMTMYGNTGLALTEARQPRFGLSSNPSQIQIQLNSGRIRATAARSETDLNFEIVTPHAVVYLSQGSYSIEVDAEETQVATRFAEATLAGDFGSVTIGQGQRALVGIDAPPSPPLPAAKNLLTRSNFSTTANDEWQTYTITPIESVTATAKVIIFENQSVLNLRSEGEDNIHSEVGVVQQVNTDVRDFQSLRVFAEVRLVDQTLPGGGQLGSEFPIMLHVAYKDAAGNDRDWFHGFYYEPPPENYILYNQPDNSSERIARFIWYPYESVNLLATLGPAKPVYVKSIRIYSSGWIYDAMVANISLLAEE